MISILPFRTQLGFVVALLVCSVVALAKDPTASPFPFPAVPPDGRSETILVSWKAGNSYVFTLLPRSKFDEFAEHIFEPIIPKLSKLHVILTVSELETQIARIPKSSRITWRDFPPEAVQVGYPPSDVVDRIKAFASAQGVDLQVNPAIYDP